MAKPTVNVFMFTGREERVDEALRFLLPLDTQDGEFELDFDRILPMPKELNVRCSRAAEGMYHLVFREAKSTKRFFHYSAKEITKQLNAASKKALAEALDLAFVYRRNIAQFGHATYYSWEPANWGTRGNAFGPAYNPGNGKMLFSTRCGAPYPVMLKLSRMFPDVVIHWECYNALKYNDATALILKNGEVLESRPIDLDDRLYAYEPEAREIVCTGSDTDGEFSLN